MVQQDLGAVLNAAYPKVVATLIRVLGDMDRAMDATQDALVKAMQHWQQVTFGGLQAGRRGNMVEIITHPLWNRDPNHFGPQLASAYAQAVATGYQVQAKSLFEVTTDSSFNVNGFNTTGSLLFISQEKNIIISAAMPSICFIVFMIFNF